MRHPVLAAGLAGVLLIGGCTTPQQQVSAKEDLLAAAGFSARPANTPARVASLHNLPAGRFVTRAQGNAVIYVMADPLVCNCLYVGNQQAYDAYKHEVFARNLADERQMTAMTYQDRFDWGGWDTGYGGWGPWGGPFYGGLGTGPFGRGAF